MKIVYGTDGSQGARIALDYLVALPLGDRDEVRVVVVPVLRRFGLAFDPSIAVGPMIEAALEAADEIARSARESLRRGGVTVSTIVRGGTATTAILEEATRAKVDLIVVGSRGLGSISGVVLGSTARWLAQHATVPVLVVRERRVAPQRILVADETALTRAEVAVLARLAGPGVSTTRATGGDATRIVAEARAIEADLIVLAPAQGAVDRVLSWASVATEVLARARCAVLVPGANAAL